MTAPNDRDRAPSNNLPANNIPPNGSPSANGPVGNPNQGYSAQASHQRLPSETAEEYQRRRQALELEAEARRLQMAERKARAARTNLISARLINGAYFLVGALEILLLLRFILRISGANNQNAFATFILNLSAPFIAPFSTLFISPTVEGARFIFDVNLLVAMLVYGILGLLAGQLIKVLVGDIRR